MPIAIEIFENHINKGTFNFEAPPRIGEKLQMPGHPGAWEIIAVRHILVTGGLTQMQIGVTPSSS